MKKCKNCMWRGGHIGWLKSGGGSIYYCNLLLRQKPPVKYGVSEDYYCADYAEKENICENCLHNSGGICKQHAMIKDENGKKILPRVDNFWSCKYFELKEQK